MSTEEKPAKTPYAVTITAIATLITAVGGLVYALKSNSIPDDPPTKPINTEKIFHGKVGKLETTYNLAFEANSDAVNGTYYYNQKQDKLYKLSGVSKNNDLHLNEFTNGTQTAKCVLKKDESGCYNGTMFNNDGRTYAMSICY